MVQTSRDRYSETRLQFYVIDYLTLKLQTEIRYEQVFYYYKLFTLNKANFEDIERELKELNRYNQIFKKLTNPKGNSRFEKLAERLQDMDISTLYPLLLYVERDSEITQANKDAIYTILDSYLTRRFLCGLTTKNYNNVFLEYLKFLNKHKDSDSFKTHLQSKIYDRNLWPSDNILLERLVERPLYREDKNYIKYSFRS